MYRKSPFYTCDHNHNRHVVSNNFQAIEDARKNWFYNLNEAHHLYNPEQSSIYRRGLEHIITRLWDHLQYDFKPKKVFKTEDEEFISFALESPFRSEPILGGIEKLKIFFSFDTKNPEAIIINDESYNDIIISPYDKPVFKIEGDNIKILSIVLYIPEENSCTYDIFEETIFEILPHELTHAMDSIRDKISISQSSLLNDVRAIYQDKCKNYNIDINDIVNRKYIDYNNPIEWYYMFAEWIYYTEKTEIKAYLESTYSDLSAVIKNPGIFLLKQNKYFNTYYKYYVVLNNLIKDWPSIKFKYKDIADELLKNLKEKQKVLIKDIPELKNKFNHEYAFITILKYWKKQLLKYLKKAESIYKYYYPIAWRFWVAYKEKNNIKI